MVTFWATKDDVAVISWCWGLEVVIGSVVTTDLTPKQDLLARSNVVTLSAYLMVAISTPEQ